MKVIWTLLHRFDGKITLNPLELTPIELEYLNEFEDELIAFRQAELEKDEANNQVGNRRTKEMDDLSDEVGKIQSRLDLYKSQKKI